MSHCLTHIIVHEVSEATLEGKWGLLRKHIEPSSIGRTHLHKLTADDLQIFYNNLIKQNMGPGSIKNIARLINQTLNIALEREYITKNVNKIAKTPSYKPEKVEAWTKAQIDHFLNSTVDSYLYPMYMVVLNSGLRPGEFFGASWDQIDFGKLTIHIDRTQSTTKERGNHIKLSPKNSSSIRTVTLPAHVISYLKRYKLEQLPNERNLILAGLNAPIMNTTTARTIFREDCGRAGVPYISLHGLRHTHATYLLTPAPEGLGISVKAVSERLGHANTTTTMNTYFSVLPNMQDIIAERLEAHAHVPVDKLAKK
jgi:integrase